MVPVKVSSGIMTDANNIRLWQRFLQKLHGGGLSGRSHSSSGHGCLELGREGFAGLFGQTKCSDKRDLSRRPTEIIFEHSTGG